MSQRKRKSSTVPTVNLDLVQADLERAQARPDLFPGIVALFGESGMGKSVTATVVAQAVEGYYVKATSTGQVKPFLMDIQQVVCGRSGGTTASMLQDISEELASTGRVLVIDEFDHVIKRNCVDVVRDIYEKSACTLLIVGEERLKVKMQRDWPQFSGRVMRWIPARATSIHEARALCEYYVDKVEIADDLLERVLAISKKNVRRLCCNLHWINECGKNHGAAKLDLEAWRDLEEQDPELRLN